MQTRVCRLYGQNDLRIETETVPTPGPGQVLVNIAAGGICGSDMHYLSHGGIGTIRVREPIILGHEASGRVLATGEGVEDLPTGTKVAVNPSRPCGTCKYCREGLRIHCLQMRFNGSAIRLPHEQGLFRDLVTVDAAQCIPVAAETDLRALACSEPLAVCLHAAHLAGPLADKRVLVTGAGPIGALCAGIAAQAGASEVVVTDLQNSVLDVATAMGATQTINVAETPEMLSAHEADKGHFDIVFECSAAAPAMQSAIQVLRPRGTLVQVGVVGETPLPINALVAKEIRVQGTHRFDTEFAEAVQAITSGRLNVAPIISASLPLDQAAEAFALAADRSRAVKVHLTFDRV